MSNIEIPLSIDSIGTKAFYNCHKADFGIAKVIKRLGTDAFTNSKIRSGIEVYGKCFLLNSTDNTAMLISKDVSLDDEGDIVFNKNEQYKGAVYIGGSFSIRDNNGKSRSYTVIAINDYALANCKDLEYVRTYNSVKDIGDGAFANCVNIPCVFFEGISSIATDACEGTRIENLLLETPLEAPDFIAKVGTDRIFTLPETIETMKKYTSSDVFSIYPVVSDTISYLRGISFRAVASSKYMTLNGVASVEEDYSFDENGFCFVKNKYFFPGCESYASILYTIQGCPDTQLGYVVPCKTKDIEFNVKMESRTQTTLTISCTITEDETWALKEIVFNGEKIKNGGTVTYSDLFPGQNMCCDVTAYYDESDKPWDDYQTVFSKNFYFDTKSLNPQVYVSPLTPTTALIRGVYDIGDYNVANTKIYFNGTEIDGGLLTGLEPEVQYNVMYCLYNEYGSRISYATTKFTTPALELTTLKPRCVSSTCAVVAATTNIGEDETNVGFQWKKYDAPASLAPNEGYAAIYDGKLEGYVQNLQPAFYYNVRAFYKSAAGIYYYGDWVTFDPSDFSYFEPTVHTYETLEVGSNSAKVKGYVLAGTDYIVEQGFEYWPIGTSQSKTMRVKATAENNVATVFCTGQVMIGTLTDLQPSCIYCFRSFVKTVSGTTYGEEQTFTTEASTTGIDNVEIDAYSPVVIGYYDLSGRKYNEPQKGLNIIRYSDGSARKILVK